MTFRQFKNENPPEKNSTIIMVELNGGLGNQMFQYAFGRALSLKYDCDFYINIDTLKKGISNRYFTARQFELNIFDIKAREAGENEIRKFSSNNLLAKIFKKQKSKNIIFIERSFKYHPESENIQGNVYLKGYWQTEKYFTKWRNAIMKDFTFLLDKNKLTQKIGEDISLKNSVSIHIRRGDYLTSPSSNEVHGVLPLQYYIEAMEVIQNKVSDAFFFVFSDDSNWVKQQFFKDKNNMVIVDHNTEKESWQDMYLMSLCNHNIIANSSFSWWGAWLNNKPGKIVIAPLKWFANVDLNTQTSDIIPDSWIKL